MSEEKRYTIQEAQRFFAQEFNAKVWDLLQKSERSAQNDESMLHYAHASYCHWLSVGTGLHQQRAEWLIAHVYTVLGRPDAALRHAARCLELTSEHAQLMQDFDLAYAYEGFARANALAQNQETAQKYIALAEEAGQAVKNEEDKAIFFGDFNGGSWYGMR